MYMTAVLCAALGGSARPNTQTLISATARWFGEDEVIACAPGPYCLWANNVGPWGINGGEIKYLFYILAHTCVQHNCGSK